MNFKDRYFRIPEKTAHEQGHTSCLSINQAGAKLGLSNLLDLIRHEIIQEGGLQMHRLTFKSGQTLSIKADVHGVTVRGLKIRSEQSSDDTTVLADPGRGQPNFSGKSLMFQ